MGAWFPVCVYRFLNPSKLASRRQETRERIECLVFRHCADSVHVVCVSLSAVCTLCLCVCLHPSVSLPVFICLVQCCLARSADLSLPMLPAWGCCLGAPSSGHSLALPPGGGLLAPTHAQMSHFLPLGGQPGQEPAFPTFLPSELSACPPHLSPSPSWGKPPCGNH